MKTSCVCVYIYIYIWLENQPFKQPSNKMTNVKSIFTHHSQALRAGYEVVVGDPMEGLHDQSFKHLMHKEQNVLGSRSLGTHQQLRVPAADQHEQSMTTEPNPLPRRMESIHCLPRTLMEDHSCET